MYANARTPLEPFDSESGVEPLTWTSRIGFDRTLIERLVLSHDRLRACFAHCVGAAKRGERAEVLDAASTAASELHALHRVEALRLYPIIARQFVAEGGAPDDFTRRRLVLYSIGRRVLRILESTLTTGFSGEHDAIELSAAASLFGTYVAEKQARFYPLYLRSANKEASGPIRAGA